MAKRQIGYCTNVHAGFDLESTKSSLLEHAVRIRRRVSPVEPLPIGLWLSDAALSGVEKSDQAEGFSVWLNQQGLAAYTINGFPWGHFHQPIVKHTVYKPNWADPRRLRYTLGLIDFLDALLPTGQYGSVSTLPIAWGTPVPDEATIEAAARALTQVAKRLESIEQKTGRWICLALEPEPGCFLQRSRDVVDFFERFFPTEVSRRYLGVCHDVCHASVMFETQADVIRTYREAGIRVAKVQISSSVRLKLDEVTGPEDRAAAIGQLSAFAEDRYLHQTSVSIDGESPQFFEDLPLALDAIDATHLTQDWRVHFHVPIHLDSFGLLQTGQGEIRECLSAIDLEDENIHLEVETYAWNVLPRALRPDDLSAGIAEELLWLSTVFRDEPKTEA